MEISVKKVKCKNSRSKNVLIVDGEVVLIDNNNDNFKKEIDYLMGGSPDL